MVAYFLLFLGIFTNFNYVTLENKVNVALTAELQFNQNDIKELDRVQRYLNDIKKNILRKNLRNQYQQYNIKNIKPNGKVTISNINNVNIEKYTNFRKNHVKDTDLKKNTTRIKMANIDISVGTNSIKDINKNAKRIMRSSKNNNSIKSTVGKQQNKNITTNNIQNKLVIIDTTPQIIKNATKHKTKYSKHTTKPKATNSTLTKNTSKDNNSTKTTVGKQESKDIHIHDVQNKLIIETNTTKHKTKNKHTIKPKTLSKITASVVLSKQQNKSKSTKPPSARKHIITILATLKNNEKLKSTGTEKTKNEVRNLTTKYYHKEIKEKDKKIEKNNYSSIENYNNLDEYLKSKVKDENDGKNKEVLEKVKSDLSNLFSNDIANTTPEKADSFQELEKAFGFDM